MIATPYLTEWAATHPWKLMQERIVNRLMTADDIAAKQQETKDIPRSGE